jgi:hypothetical protein
MSLFLETLFLLLITFAIGLGVAWLVWGKSTERN